MSIFCGLREIKRFLAMFIETEEKQRVLRKHPFHPAATCLLPVYGEGGAVSATQWLHVSKNSLYTVEYFMYAANGEESLLPHCTFYV